MKRKIRIAVVVCLLAVAGVWVYWSHERQQVAVPHKGSVEASAAAASNSATPGKGGVAAATPAKFPKLNTNKLAYRLSNTTNSIHTLEAKPHAILLANAFIDTDKPLDLKIPAHLRSSGDPGAYIVQARGQTDPRFRAVLMSAGAEIVSYIPNNAYLVNIQASGAGMLAGNPLVQAVLPYEPYYKMQSSLLGMAVNQQALPPGMTLILGLFGADAATADAQIQKLGAKIIRHDQSPFGPVVRVLAPTDWTALAQSKVVQFVEPARSRVPANDLSRVMVGVSADTLTPTNYLNLYGKNVLVAVNDSGVDTNHPAFSVGGTAAAPGTVPPSRVTGLTYLDMVDTNGHGTHVAGIIAGNGSASYGGSYTNVGMFAEGSIPNADYRGKAPLANLFSLNMGNYSDYQLQTNAAIAGALISNNSWDYGNGDAEYDLAAASYDFATRDAVPFTTGSQPVLFVFAAGNSGGGDDDGTGGGGDTILSPGTAKNVITVGALEQLRNITNIVTFITPGTGTNAPTTNQVAYWQPKTDSGDQVAAYSSRGNVGIGTEGNNGRFKPDVVAPGTFVVSTSSQFNNEWDTNAYYNPTNILGTSYTYQIVDTNQLQYYSVQVPPNAVAVNITISPNRFSPVPFPMNLPIYCQQSGIPDPVNAPGSIDLTTWTNSVSIPPGGGNCTIPLLQGNGFDFAVGNTNSFQVNYNLSVQIQVTNNLGDLYSVLEGMNDSLGGYYRYESGTSMAAADVSGVLALIQDYLTNQFQPKIIPSPALMKALLINGARSVGNYGLAFTNSINFQGWGLDNIENSVPPDGLINQFNTPGSSFIVDQDPRNALATGDSHTYLVTVNTNAFAEYFQLQATLVWTDPPGDPAAAIKLVNSLDLIITNLDTGEVYFGNDISPDVGYNLPWNTNGPPNIDTINNVQNILLPPLLAGNYSVTVLGRSVNVNAVTAQTNNAAGQFAPNIVQDYALVVSIGEGEVTNAFTVADNGVSSNPTGDQDFTVITTTNAPLLNQFVGASSPLLGTNTLPLGNNTIWGPNGLVTIGQTNQWHFYVVTNTGTSADFTNAAFLTFGVNTLSIPRMGVYEDTVANATKPEANLDMFVTQDPGITNLDPAVISNCLAGVGNNRASVYNAGTQFVFYTNSSPGQVYYIGVQSEDQMGSEYDFLPVFTDIPFGGLDQNGNQIVNGLLLPMPILTGNNTHPGITNVFALAIMPMEVEKVTVTNLDECQNFGDLLGVLSFGGEKVVLNNHDGFGNTFRTRPIAYDDSRNNPLGTTNSDGPGSLMDFQAKSALGPWILSVLDNSAGGFTGQVSRLTLLIQPHRDLKQPGVIVSVPPGGWFIDWVDVPVGYTNLTFYATNVTVPAATPPIEMFEKFGNEPTLTDYDQSNLLVNGNPEGNTISVGPPLAQGRYFIGLFNPNLTTAQSVFLTATLGVDKSVNDIFNYNSGAGQPLLDDAVSSSVITVPNTVTQLVASVNVGLAVNSPRISDYTFTLVSPTGQRVLLMENRGGGDTNGAGMSFVYNNVLNATATNGAAANTNYLAVNPLGSTVPIIWNFYTVPDQMTVYDTTNPAFFNPAGPYLLYNTGMTNNLTNGLAGQTNTIAVTNYVTVPPGVSNITIIMNQFGNPAGTNGDLWTYTAGVSVTNYEYLTFTDDTNLATVPIKFAEPPFSFTESATNFVLSDFDLAFATNYFGPTNIADGFSTGWTVPTNVVEVTTVETNGQFVLVTNMVTLTNNLVSVVSDPSVALTGVAGGSNYLALGSGTITRSIPTVPGRIYNVTFQYRGPGIEGWWRGEGNGNDSSDPENNNNNGTLIGRFNFPAGEVSQAFGFQDPGNTYQFAGTNTYVQVPASPSLNVGAGGGFTVEGWINPTNLMRPQPLVEWIAHTNVVDTNLTVIQGPILDPAEGHFYYLLASTNWFQSETWAQQLGGHLAKLETANEGQWVYDTFTAYGTLNRDLWIGLNDLGYFHWSDTTTNLTYTNWVPGEPGASLAGCPVDRFTAIMGPTNAYPGLWNLEGNNRENCGQPPTLPIYGVVEVPTIATNGVQFWISGTNWTPGETNTLQGCLYANIVDTNYVSHEIFSPPGLLTTNIFQHVALTYNTNSGIAALYLNGTNVATTNLGVFVPKTDGDLLLGLDMSRYTNNFYGGEMDEMSVYGRAMSLAEISAIYHASADTTNRLIGKFDPQVTPAVGLAEAMVTFGDSSNIIFGANNQWLVNSFTFTATTNSMPLTISGIAPGILLDSFAVHEAPLTNLYYFPEQALSSLIGDSAAGNWTLQVWDNRVGALVPNVDQLVNWQLSFVLESNGIVAAALPPETPVASTVPAGQTVYYSVTVPAWAHDATNLLVSSSQTVDLLYFSPVNPPGTAVAPDATMLAGATSGIGNPVLTTASAPPFQLQPGSTYYLGIRNSSAHSALVTLEVDFDILGLTNGAPFTDILTNEYSSVRYFSFDVSSNAYEATFQLLKLRGNADLVVRKGVPLPALNSDDYGGFNNSNADENIYVLTNSAPVPLSAGRWYMGVLNRDGTSIHYSVLAKELDITNLNLPTSVMPAIINLTNGVPFTWTIGPGADLTNFFRFQATNAIADGTNIFLHGLRFELFDMSGDGDLTLQTNMLPLAPPFFQSSQNGPGRPELIYIFTNNVLTNLASDWYLGVPNHEITNITYSIVAEIITNLYFPAFPEAQGAGGGAVGGRFGDVYHVISTADAGAGTLRDAVNSAVTNRTVVFDVSGTINLVSPLVITNSYFTIAGETAPGGGITVAGNMTTVTNAHDVIIRDVRFRRGAADDSLQFVNASNVIADHISAEWTSDNLVSVLNCSNVTVQWSIMADSLYSTNFNSTNPPTGSLLRQGSGNLSFHHNLYADNYIGSPRLGDNLTLDFVNNVIYNWGLFSGLADGGSDLLDFSPNGCTNQLNYVCNYLIAGPDTAAFAANYSITNIAYFGGLTNALAANWIFQTNNFIDSDTNGVLNGSDTGWGMFTNDYASFGRAFYTPPVSVDEAYIAYERVLDFAGVYLAQRDPVDTNIVTKVRNQNGRLISAPPLSGIVAWWKGEGNALDSAGGNNGTLTGGLGFAPGEVRQAFNFKDTNGYVFVPASASLNVGTKSGFTVEEWINPSNVSSRMPLFGWGTNAASGTVGSSNILAGPILNTNNGHFYYLLQTTTWSNSEAIAEQLGGHLATIRNAGENNWVSNSFINYGGVPRNLWIGFTDSSQVPGAGNFGWIDGEPVTYTYWAGGEPNDACGGEWYIMMYSPAFAPNTAGWNDVDNFSSHCPPPGITPTYGVVEVTSIPWLWSSVGGSGSLYADLVDTTNGSHVIASAGGLLQSNVYQHIALTYSTNSGIATLYLNGTVVASANLGSFVPNTAGDVYLGKRIDGVPTDIYSGGMDEVTLYKRALSQGEIQSIYQAGAVGKFGSQFASAPSLLPYLDTDQDGIPDFWEYTFTPALVFTNSNNNDRDGDGYTDLEEYNNWLAAPHALTTVTNPVGVDLYQLCGESGHLAFYVTNGIHGTVHLTNVLDNVTNTSAVWSNNFAIFTPTNTPGSGTNYYGYASFDFFVTNLDTAAYFGPVTVSVIVSAVPIAINSNMPPVITPLLSGISSDPTNYGGSDYYSIVVPSTAAGALFEIDNPTGPMAMAVNHGPNLPSLSSCDYYTNLPPPPGRLQIVVLTNSQPVPLHVGTNYMAAINEAGPGSNVVYTAKITLLGNLLPPAFLYPTNTTVTNILETVPWSVTCLATDFDTPALPLSFALVNGPTNLTVSTSGIINWMPTEAQGPATNNSVAVSVSNGAFAITNTFTIIVEESNLPPTLPYVPNQYVIATSTLVVTNTATDPDIPTNALGYTLYSTVIGTNLPVIDTNGVITWTPTLDQVGSNYLFTTVVTDTNPWAVNAQSLSTTNTFLVTVLPPVPPFPPLTNVVDPGGIQWYGVIVPTNAIAGTNTLVFATGLVNLWYSTNDPHPIIGPADVELLTNALSGTSVVTATTTPVLVPGGHYYLGVQNTNVFAVTNGLEVTFALAVPPPVTNGFVLSIVYTNIAGTNGFLISWYAPTNDQFHLQWTPVLVPPAWGNFNGVISDASTSATNGLFQYFDDGSQTGGFGSTRFYRVLLLASPTNTAPFFLYAPGILYANPSNAFVFTNTAGDWDIPAQTLAYSVTNTLDGANVVINPGSGVITWTPNSALLGQTNLITTIVTDNGVPPKSATNILTVVVSTNVPPVTVPAFASISIGTNGVKFQWTAPTNDQFQIRWTTNLAPAAWHLFPNTNTSITGNFNFMDTNPLVWMKFYQLILLP